MSTRAIATNHRGYDGQLYLLAFDHRDSLERLVGDPERVRGAKELIWEGFQRAVSEGAPKEYAGVLLDVQYGGTFARQAKAGGYKLAMPVEKSGKAEFDFEYGQQFGEKLEEFDPDFAKVLVRYNPEGDTAMNERQIMRLAQLSRWLRKRQRKFLFELLIPPEVAQLERLGGNVERYDRELRPQLMLEAIAQLQNGDVEPDIWKIEGLEERDTCREIAQLVRQDGRDHVSCVVLGRGASHEKVDAWLRGGSGVDGYVGFAIGRSIFGKSVKAYATDPHTFDRNAAIEEIAQNYLHCIDVYEEVAMSTSH